MVRINIYQLTGHTFLIVVQWELEIIEIKCLPLDAINQVGAGLELSY